MLADRLKAIRKKKGCTQTDLAKQFGVTQQAIAKWESAASLPDSGTIARLAEFFGVSADYLLGVTNSFSSAGAFAQVQIIGSVKAGYGGLAYEEDLGSAPAAVRDADAYRYLVVKGDSMAPHINDGDLALVRLQPTLENGDLGVVIYQDEEVTLKKFRRAGDTVYLEPFNEEYDTLTVKGNDINELIVFGKVIETVKRW